MATPAWISLGSNLGDRKATLDAAVAALAETPGVAVWAVSSYHETRPVGGPGGQGAFLNAAARLDTTLEPLELLDALQAIEAEAGRVRTVRWAERTLDLDILVYGTKTLDTPSLKIPHPRLAVRRFVLAPLAEIAPDVVDLASRERIERLLANLDRRPRLVALDGPFGSLKEAVFRRLVQALPGIAVPGEPADPASVADEATLRSYLAAIDRNADALRPDRWDDATSAGTWIVADFHLALDLARALSRGGLPGGLPTNPVARVRGRLMVKERLSDGAGAGLDPTFAVILPRALEVPGSSFRTRTPLLRPESHDPEAIVAEVLATCRGIEGL